ncbi:hypothetical protein ARMSODRAFT_982863 [Armillaria solidipes]|uniref:Uncharacterized protein n=1 Tax=Armillaria solidipes TaxID=1076256 RepID=A0A2H3B4Y0_9AGAR|nr:hypothetical protein ARMSODRAFT_982863 [Armillaria solidipes]
MGLCSYFFMEFAFAINTSTGLASAVALADSYDESQDTLQNGGRIKLTLFSNVFAIMIERRSFFWDLGPCNNVEFLWDVPKAKEFMVIFSENMADPGDQEFRSQSGLDTFQYIEYNRGQVHIVLVRAAPGNRHPLWDMHRLLLATSTERLRSIDARTLLRLYVGCYYHNFGVRHGHMLQEEVYTDEEELQIYNIKHYKELPEVTLSASDGTSHAESSIAVLKQRSFTGRVLPSAIADIPCAVLGLDGMLERLNSTVRTPGSPLYRVREYFVAENYDLGTAYAHLRRYPYNFNIDRHVTAHKSNEKRQQHLVEHRKIKNAPPRRMWDLHAN